MDYYSVHWSAGRLDDDRAWIMGETALTLTLGIRVQVPRESRWTATHWGAGRGGDAVAGKASERLAAWPDDGVGAGARGVAH